MNEPATVPGDKSKRQKTQETSAHIYRVKNAVGLPVPLTHWRVYSTSEEDEKCGASVRLD